mmetsp:Transcript_96754/g.273361  ORF Transcript_96754/g.273361 Transcript_96754/m.273361 type:complete len:257 (-) Transcript_96754:1015-1785(-)
MLELLRPHRHVGRVELCEVAPAVLAHIAQGHKRYCTVAICLHNPIRVEAVRDTVVPRIVCLIAVMVCGDAHPFLWMVWALQKCPEARNSLRHIREIEGRIASVNPHWPPRISRSAVPLQIRDRRADGFASGPKEGLGLGHVFPVRPSPPHLAENILVGALCLQAGAIEAKDLQVRSSRQCRRQWVCETPWVICLQTATSSWVQEAMLVRGPRGVPAQWCVLLPNDIFVQGLEGTRVCKVGLELHHVRRCICPPRCA